MDWQKKSHATYACSLRCGGAIGSRNCFAGTCAQIQLPSVFEWRDRFNRLNFLPLCLMGSTTSHLPLRFNRLNWGVQRQQPCESDSQDPYWVLNQPSRPKFNWLNFQVDLSAPEIWASLS